MSKTNIDRMIGGKSKESVDYRQHEKCGSCAQFNGRSACAKVEGRISSSAVCDLWAIDEKMPAKTGKQYIKDAYDKSRKEE